MWVLLFSHFTDGVRSGLPKVIHLQAGGGETGHSSVRSQSPWAGPSASLPPLAPYAFCATVTVLVHLPLCLPGHGPTSAPQQLEALNEMQIKCTQPSAPNCLSYLFFMHTTGLLVIKQNNKSVKNKDATEMDGERASLPAL